MTRRTYEPYDQNVRLILVLVAALVIGVVLSVAAVALQYRWLGGRATRAEQAPSPLTAERQPPSGPLLEDDPTAALEALRAREEAWLSSYGWVDREQGIVRIPIDRAMMLEASR